MSSVPQIDWTLARATGARLAPLGPRLSPGEVAELVGDLRQAAANAPALVTEVSGLPLVVPADELVLDRPGWVRGVSRTAEAMFGGAVRDSLPRHADAGDAAHPTGRTAGERASARLNGTEIGVLLGLLSGRVLGQFDPFRARPRLMLVAPNIAKVTRDLDLVPGDFNLWVCLHEQTHRVQFSNAPWLVDHLQDLAGELIEFESELGTAGELRWLVSNTTTGRQGGLLEMLMPPTAKRVVDQVTAVMSLLEGHADVMMDLAGPDQIATLPAIRQRFDERRARQGVAAAVGRLIGMDAKLAQYREGARFCRQVIDRIGVEGLNRAFEGPAMLPTRGELADPQAWVDRMVR